MTEADVVFERFPGFIQEYVYSHGWRELREVQLEAAKVILNTDKNLLLSSSTASGKTEAVFFPILSLLCEEEVKQEGVSVLYIAPLKSLINDQFLRMQDLLDQSGIPVTHWHGDVGTSQKNKLLQHPSGILQITPESLESMVMNRSGDLARLFGALRFVVIDEVHTLISSDRGNQIRCLLSRISRMTGVYPRRIGLSATIGDPALCALWLEAGSGRQTAFPVLPREKLRLKLGLEHFYIQNPESLQSPLPVKDCGVTEENAGCQAKRTGGRASADAGFEYIYDAVKNKKALVFSNSREE
ncbi:MAG: DEAD/DEAH box helicase, partial [Clostridia bacterium]|nr:DEAD/DEAH box helicase [Clostridia bacterium]